MSFRKIDTHYLSSLSSREQALDNQIQDRQNKQKEVNRLFLDHVKKQLDLLMGQKEKMTHRNEQYLAEIKGYHKQFNRVLPELMQAQEKLNKAKINYQRAMEKNIK